MHVALTAIAGSLGVNLLPKDDEVPEASVDAPSGPSIAEIAARVKAPGVGIDTLSASREVMRAMAPQ